MANTEIELLRKAGRHALGRAWWLFAIQLAASAAGIVALKVIPKQYESTTTIRVEKSQLINPLTRGLAVSSEMDDRLRGIREEILSRDYLEKIISRLSLEPRTATPLEHEGLVQQMLRHTTITTKQREADTFQVTYRGRDPKEVRDVTNLLAGIFIEDSLSNKAGDAGAAVEFLEGQLQIYRGKLEESEAALRRFTEKYVDQLPSNRAAQLSRVEQLRATLIEVQSSLRQARIQRDLLQPQTVSGTAPDEDAPRVANPAAVRLRECEAQLRRLLVDYSETYPDVVALKSEIEGLRREVALHPTVTPSEAASSRQPSVQDALSLGQLQQIELQVGALTTREQQLTHELARYERKVQGIPEVEQELARLKRDYDVNNDIYNNFLRRLEEAKVSKELEVSKKGEVFRILEAAVLPLTPAWPGRLQTVLAGIGAGLLLNLLLVYALAQHDTSFQTAEEVQKALGLKVLAGIPTHVGDRERVAQRARSAALAASWSVYAVAMAVFLLWGQVSLLLRGGR